MRIGGWCPAIILVTNDMWEERTDRFQTPLTDVSVLTFLPSHLPNDARSPVSNYFIPFEIQLQDPHPVTSFCLTTATLISVVVEMYVACQTTL